MRKQSTRVTATEQSDLPASYAYPPEETSGIVSRPLLDLRAACAIGVFVDGNHLTRYAFGANERARAFACARSFLRKGHEVRLVWLNVGAWCPDLWVKDAGRRNGQHPDDAYGRLDLPAAPDR